MEWKLSEELEISHFAWLLRDAEASGLATQQRSSLDRAGYACGCNGPQGATQLEAAAGWNERKE